MYFVICVIAVLIDRIVGDPKKWTHPVVYIGNLISFFESKWNHGGKRRIKGLLTVFLTVSITTGTVFLIVILAMKVHFMLWLAVEIFLISLALAQKSLKEAAMLVYDSLKADDLPEARKYLSWIVGRDTNHLDESEIVRGVIETVSENTSDGVTAPLMYALCFGATGAWCYKAINTLDSMIGYKNESYADFGYAAAKLDDIMNFVPSRISGWFLILFTKCEMKQPLKYRFKTWLKDAQKHPSPNSGYMEAATAVQLGIRLGGFNRYGGVESFRAYMGAPNETMQKIHIKKAIQHMYVCTWCVVVTGGILYAIACAWS